MPDEHAMAIDFMALSVYPVRACGPDSTPTAGHGGRVSQLDHSHVVIGGVALGTRVLAF